MQSTIPLDVEISKELGTWMLSASIPTWLTMPSVTRVWKSLQPLSTRPASQITFKHGLLLWNDWEDH